MKVPESTLDVDCRPTIGVDPGAVWTGLAVRVGRECVDATTVGRPDRGSDADDPAADRVWVERVLARLEHLAARHAADAPEGFLIAVEAVNRPKPYVAGRKVPRSPRVGWDTARTMLTYGALLGTYPDAVLVPPERNGERGADAYPDVLRRIRPRSFTDSDHHDRRHERSAYDVAGVAQLIADRRTPA